VRRPGAQPGNKNARKEHRLLTTELLRQLRERPDEAPAICQTLIDKAKAGEPWAQNLIWDRVDGKVTQIIGGDPENPLEISGITVVWGASSQPPGQT
jgi:hypothetical protein